jgi:hypothetical protein
MRDVIKRAYLLLRTEHSTCPRDAHPFVVAVG